MTDGAGEKNTTAEQFLLWLKDDKILERFSYNGLRAQFGGLMTGGGFALGPGRRTLCRAKERWKYASAWIFPHHAKNQKLPPLRGHES